MTPTRLCVAVLPAALAATLASCCCTPTCERPAPRPSPETLAAGEAAFTLGKCAKCHGADARGGPRAPDLTDDEWLHCDGSPADIETVLRAGVPREQMADPTRRFVMNPATNLVPDDQIAPLAAYVWSLSHEPRAQARGLCSLPRPRRGRCHASPRA